MERCLSLRKREGCGDGGGGGGGGGENDDDDPTVMKRPRTPGDACSEEDVVMDSWLLIEEDDDSTVDELMKFLDDDSNTTATKVKFIQNPYSSPLIFQSSSSYITINGNEETCGSSFSDWESSVMASVDMGGFVNAAGKLDCINDDGFEFCEWFQGGNGGAWIFDDIETAALGKRKGGSDGYDEWFLDGHGGSRGGIF